MANDETKKIQWKKILLILVGVLLLSALPLFLFRPVKQEDPLPKKQDRFTFMTKTPRTEKDSHGLEYWEKTGNPELFAKPDSKFGYSAFLNPEMNHLKPVGSNVEHLPTLPGSFSVGKIALPGERSPKDLLSQVRFPLIDTTQKYKALFVKSPTFLLEGGIILPIQDFKQPKSNLKELKPTFIKVSRTNDDAPPMIVVEQSCGDANLDNAAVRLLFQRAAINEKISGIIRVEWLNGDKK